MSNSKVNGTALITGSSSGIGAVYADRLAKRGYDLIVAARNQGRLNALADRLKSETGRSVEVVVADLNQKADLAKVESILRKDVRVTLSYVIGFTHSLQHELSGKGIRVQAVLPGATATEFWDLAGYSHQNFPKETVMSAEDLVDAALIGLDQGEVVTIPPLQDGEEWNTWEAQRRAMSGHLSNVKPAPRYAKV